MLRPSLLLPIYQQGSSLVELMISMALGFASLTAMTSLVAHGISLNNSLMAKSRLDEEINGVLAVIGQDLKRAGYQGLTEDMLLNPTVFVNPFANSIQISNFGSEVSNSCITFDYDRNQNGLLDTKLVNEEFGFRLKDKAIEIRVDGYKCSQSYWQDLTDPQVVQINDLVFSIDKLTHQQISMTQINVSLQAELVKYPEFSKLISANFLVKNYE
ncbi:prepilin peptidase dependent protein B [Paraglaciecola aquimarina]|uniref:Prepilin peptidase dependent protein B n=1 Tax=Paraglaciecola algarum TaxID=3050085 RepID=A0ABS9D5X4_9ALTE|nr:prepilin peptidase dependent protein B [Paraglaciecola sp. G1-23]MCF2948343.1 prepilin peptidase dependent protein B [Paraglaciecola sp. G1-23]